MSKFTNKSADIIPIGGKKLTKPEHNIPAFPCYPKMLSTIAEISAIKNLDVRAEQCVLARITAEHLEGRLLLESCRNATTSSRDICILRLEMYQDLQMRLPSELRKQFRDLITKTLQYQNDDQDCEHMEDRLFLLCNFLRSDRAIMPRKLCDAIRTLRDLTWMTVVPVVNQIRTYW